VTDNKTGLEWKTGPDKNMSWDEGKQKMLQLIRGDIDHVFLERLYRRKDDTVFWGHLSGSRLCHLDGSFSSLVGVITDITEKKELEVQVQQAQKMEAIGTERILFVDDEESMVNLNQQRLEKLGYTVIPKTDPSEALEFFRAKTDQIDLVITDMTMPHMTGDRLAEEILKIRPNMPIILCTGYSQRISSEKAQELGIRKYIEKPIEIENLARSVKEVMDGR